jgi:cell division septum initiation protein DivIVA
MTTSEKTKELLNFVEDARAKYSSKAESLRREGDNWAGEFEEFEETLESIEKRIAEAAAEMERYRKAFCAARAFIEVHVGDPDITPNMVHKYAEYQAACEGLV